MTDIPPANILRIRLQPASRMQCFDKNLLRQALLMNNEMVVWKQKSPDRIPDATGRGRGPTDIRVYKLPQGTWVNSRSYNIIMSHIENDVSAVVNLKQNPAPIYIGNAQGTFGVSQLHGQAPAHVVYVPGNEMDDWPLNAIDRNYTCVLELQRGDLFTQEQAQWQLDRMLEQRTDTEKRWFDDSKRLRLEHGKLVGTYCAMHWLLSVQAKEYYKQ